MKVGIVFSSDSSSGELLGEKRDQSSDTLEDSLIAVPADWKVED